MVMIFEFNKGQSGTLIDSVSKTAGTLTAGTGGFKKTEKGLAMEFDGSATDIDSGVTLTGVKTIVIFSKITTNTKLLLDDGSDKLEITGGSFSGTGLTQNYVNNTDTDVSLLHQWQCSISEFSSGIDFSTDLEITPTAQTYIARIICYDSVLTATERNNIQIEFIHSYGSEKPVRNFVYPKPTDLSYERNTNFTGDEYTQVMEITDNASDTSSLRLNNSGDFAVVDWTGDSDFQEISTSAETTSSVIPSTVKIFAKNSVLTYFRSTNNNFSFDIASLPSGLTYYYNYGSNTTSGDIASLPSGLTYYYNYGSNQVDTYTSGHTFDSGITYFLHLPAAGYGLSSTEVDNLLIDLDSSGMSSGTIDLSGNNTAPGASGETAIDALRAKGITVTVTGGY